MTDLSERDLELIEIALESAVSATASFLLPKASGDSLGKLNQEYQDALTRVTRIRDEQQATITITQEKP